jgi:PQQ-dependent dehydrogenase (methanol/ethanol family)
MSMRKLCSNVWALAAIGATAVLGIQASVASAQDALAPGALQPASFGPNCSVCHGGDAAGTDRAPSLVGNRRLRGQSEADFATVIRNGRGNMPSFSFLSPEQIQALAYYVRSLNADAFDMKPAGDIAAGAGIFFGSGHCAECHTAQGHGGIDGPDLSNIAHLSTLAELTQSILQPDARISTGYGMVTVNMRDGTGLRGFARAQTAHSIDLQTKEGRLLLLSDEQYKSVIADKTSLMPAFRGTAVEQRDLLAFLSSLAGVATGPDHALPDTIEPAAIDAVLHPKPGDWPTYAGTVNGNRYSALDAINVKNVSRLHPAWVHPMPYSPLETTPLVLDGVMYVTGPNQVDALDGRTGTEIWSWTRPRSGPENISGDAAKGANRGVAVLGDRVYFITDNAHLICLQRVSGALLWEVAINDQPGHYGATSAPLVIGDLVIVGVSGGDEAIRGSFVAYKATTGELAWRFWTVPKAGEPGSESWQGAQTPMGGGTWTTPSYDTATGVLYVPVGNPYPDTDGDQRGGDNLYTDSDLAIDPKTGKLLWYFQYTPHDLHDWDANQPLALIDAPFQGQQRKLLLHANRNGFLYVLDRTNGKFLQASAMVKKLTWASGVGKDGRPILLPANETNEVGVKTCPAVRGATNWYSTAFNPATQLYYVMTVEDCSSYRKAHDGGYGFLRDPADPSKKVLRAFMVDSGKIAWEVPMDGNPERNYSGVLSTAGGLVFFGETSGGFAAVDAKTGKSLWHFDANQGWKGSPMTYTLEGRQYVAIASESNILSFTLADK